MPEEKQEVSYSGMITRILTVLHSDRREGDWEAYVNGMGGFVNKTRVNHDAECTRELEELEKERWIRYDSKEGTDGYLNNKEKPGRRLMISRDIADRQEVAVLKCLKRGRKMDFTIKGGEF
jgi:hypothetical protein